ncbi:MAG: glutaredoxin family protein [Rothia sp. (in: high G+C Gram-positive bacteria)]|nr:glutaredoxin family protein [Rothia sp. (in: high G+C Gram-positive bacteria)]
MNNQNVPRVTLLTRPGCHLCEAARDVVAQVTRDVGLYFEEVNVDEHTDLKARHDTEIPVVMVNGVPTDFWQINGKRLTKILRAELGTR